MSSKTVKEVAPPRTNAKVERYRPGQIPKFAINEEKKPAQNEEIIHPDIQDKRLQRLQEAQKLKSENGAPRRRYEAKLLVSDEIPKENNVIIDDRRRRREIALMKQNLEQDEEYEFPDETSKLQIESGDINESEEESEEESEGKSDESEEESDEELIRPVFIPK
jgi:hypothetical protein